MNSETILIFMSLVTLSMAASPAVIWSSDTSEHPTVVAGHTLTANEVYDSYLKENTGFQLLFLVDELNVEDFLQYPKSFDVIQNLKSAAHLPLVENQHGAALLDVLKGKYQGHVLELASDKIKDWNFNVKNSGLLVFTLKSVKGTSSVEREAILTENSNLIGGVLSKLKNHPYHAVLTGSGSSIHKRSISEEQSVANRHLLQADVKTAYPLFNVSDCLYIDTSGIVFAVNKVKESLPVDVAAWDVATTSTCWKLEASLKPGNNFSSFKLAIEFDKLKGGNWQCGNVTVTYKKNDEDVEKSELFACGDSNDLTNGMAAPSGMSYGCAATVLAKNATSITFSSLQAQPGAKKGEWGSVYDCVGFFTMPLLTGLFITFLLAAGLLVGITSMMAIQTPDRFDDPKGPMISVPTNE